MKLKYASLIIILSLFQENVNGMQSLNSYSIPLQEDKAKIIKNVPMWGAAHIFHQTQEQTTTKQTSLQTDGLNGCTATISLITYHNGTTCSIMTHYPPLNSVAHVQALKKHLDKCNKKANSDIRSSHLIIAAPSEYIEPDLTERWKLEMGITQTKRSVNRLRDMHKKTQNTAEVTSSVLPYNQNENPNATPYPDIVFINSKHNNTLYCNICNTYKIDL
jgi:hypothetical protein